MRALGLLASATAALVLASCGGGDDDSGEPVDRTGFLDALGTVDAGEPVGAGIGWIDVAAIRDESSEPKLTLRHVAPALGPGGGDLIEDFQPKLARLGVAPFKADDALSITASYTFGVRLDGVDPSQVAGIAKADGEEVELDADDWTGYDLADRGVKPDSKLTEAADALASHIGIGPDSVVFSRADQARGDLTFVDEPGDDTAPLLLAAECVGDVIAARIVPNNFTYISGTGPDFFVMGVRAPDGDVPGEEVLCGVDAEPEDIDRYAAALEEQLAPDAIDVTTEKPISEQYASAEVDTLEGDGYEAARATLTLANGTQPGAVLRGFDVGSVVTYFGLQGPGSGVPPS